MSTFAKMFSLLVRLMKAEVAKAVIYLKKWFKRDENSPLPLENSLSNEQEDDSVYLPSRKFYIVNDWKISTLEAGKGEETLLLVHGLGSEAKHWEKNISELAKNFRVIALDLPGYGQSEKRYFTPKEGMIQFFVNILKEFIQQQIAEPVFLVGHSMGGQTAMCFAAQNPDLLHKLVLLAPAGVEDYSEKQAAVMDNLLSFYPVLGKNKTAVKIGFRQNFYEMPPDAEPLINERIALAESEDYPLYTKLISQCVRAILTTKPEFSKIRTKTLIIYGENDRLIPNAVLNPKQKTMHIADRAGRLIADSKVILLKKTGHFLQFEKSEEINFLIKQFLANDK